MKSSMHYPDTKPLGAKVKDTQRHKIESDVEEYLAQGGEIAPATPMTDVAPNNYPAEWRRMNELKTNLEAKGRAE